MNVVAMGMCTPLGLNWRAGCAELDAGTQRLVQTQFELAPDERVRACRLPLLPPHLSRSERAIGLAVTALGDLLSMEMPAVPARVPVFLALPDLGEGAELDAQVVVQALRSSATTFELGDVTLLRAGRAGFFHALGKAVSVLRRGGLGWALVGAVDSLCDLVSLKTLIEQDRVLSRRNVDGIVPGEGAAFLLLTSERISTKRSLGRVKELTLESEPEPYATHEAESTATGLTAAMATLRSLHPGLRVDHAFSCHSPQRYWARELVQAYLRNAELFPEPFVVNHIGEVLGELGAASGAVQTVRALAATADRPGTSLTFGASDLGQVGACLTERTR